MSNKIIAIVGPTASGKSEVAVSIAKKYNGEIISCDSRQIYKGMDIGTGKVAGKWVRAKKDGRQILTYRYGTIIHHCIDCVDPKKQYSAALFQKDAQTALDEIRRTDKLPVLCGGTGMWMDVVLNNQKLPEVKPNFVLRKKLEKKSVEELYEELKQLDPERAGVIDWHNKRRLIRSLEIIISTGQPMPKLATNPAQNVLWIGLYPGQEELYKKIDARLKERLQQGMTKEVLALHNSGVSWEKLESFGLEYKFTSLFLQKKLSKDEMIGQLSFASKHYAKRQMTWFRKNDNIIWLTEPKAALDEVNKYVY